MMSYTEIYNKVISGEIDVIEFSKLMTQLYEASYNDGYDAGYESHFQDMGH